jgi:Domain of unknown function (DUF4838)
MVELDLSQGWRVSGAPEAALAAAELEEGLAGITGGSGRGGRVVFELVESSGAGESFRWDATPAVIRLEGAGRRGLLHGVFGLLAALGVRWPWPGRAVRVGSPVLAVRATVEEEPVLRGRCLVLGERGLLEAAEDWIVWAARNRLNTIFAHVSTQRAPFGAAPEGLWRQRRGRLVALARERGMAIEHGGHLLPELVSAEALARAAHELEVGTPAGAVQALRAVVSAQARAHPEAEVLHLWGADSAAGAEAATARSEHALRLTNAAAAAVERVAPTVTVASLAYHDTLAVPAAVRPRHNVCLLWAPRERSYDHPADAGPNAGLWELFQRQVAHYATAGARPPRVFEYYLDGILFGRGVPELGRVMTADLAAYASAGAHTVQALMTGTGPWQAPHPNPWLFSRLAWNPQQDAQALLHDWRAAMAGFKGIQRT